MRVKFIVLAIALIGSLASTTCEAVDWHKFWADFHLVKQRNNAWPQPFVHQDQQAYFGTINPMIDAGWQVECTLAGHHFDRDSNQLNNAGEAKLVSILRTIPKDRQQVFVTSDQSDTQYNERVEAVRTKLTSWSVGSIPVEPASIGPSPMTGGYAETNFGDFQQGVPKPKLGSANVGNVGGNGN